jgi:4-hydroxybenzoate polyprenyltransferase
MLSFHHQPPLLLLLLSCWLIVSCLNSDNHHAVIEALSLESPHAYRSPQTGFIQKPTKKSWQRNHHHSSSTIVRCAAQWNKDGDSFSDSSITSIAKDYFQILRPVTIVQAVGALVVGRLALSPKSIRTSLIPLILTSLSVYLSYGSGMAMNDVVDARMDAMHADKYERPVASGRISQFQGWLYCFLLCTLSLGLAYSASSLVALPTSSYTFSPLVLWTFSNILVMLGYALGLQKVFLLKNLLCGYLAISPLIGASILDGGVSSNKLYLLAATGFPLQVAREILKDAEDVEVDRGKKQTLPLLIGVETSRKLAYTLVFLDMAGMVLTPFYWNIFASKVPVYPIGVMVGFAMCFRASREKSLGKGQKVLKESIYFLLAGMIGSLLLQ